MDAKVRLAVEPIRINLDQDTAFHLVKYFTGKLFHCTNFIALDSILRFESIVVSRLLGGKVNVFSIRSIRISCRRSAAKRNILQRNKFFPRFDYSNGLPGKYIRMISL